MSGLSLPISIPLSRIFGTPDATFWPYDSFRPSHGTTASRVRECELKQYGPLILLSKIRFLSKAISVVSLKSSATLELKN